MSSTRIYRGKRKDNGEWIKGYLWVGADHTYITPYNLGVDYNNETHRITACAYEVDYKTVGQYIGLTDKNRKQIFERDIVNCVYDGKLRTYVVVWDKDELDFKATNGGEQYGINYVYLPCCDEVEIIGNIHDNPELLKRGNITDKSAQEKRIRELEKGLAHMVVQFCSDGKFLQHKFMETEETAFNLLGVKNGDTVESVYRKFYTEE